jgi:Flp pilus assembly protein TadB
VFLLVPLVVIAATFVVLWNVLGRQPGSDSPRWRLFALWAAAGAAMTFGVLTGLSIGVFVLPFSTALVLWVAWRTPHPREALGFVEGIGAVLLLVALINRAGDGIDPMPWLLAGVSLCVFALLMYGLLRRQAAPEPRGVPPP